MVVLVVLVVLGKDIINPILMVVQVLLVEQMQVLVVQEELVVLGGQVVLMDLLVQMETAQLLQH
jgi:hypothetical protein